MTVVVVPPRQESSEPERETRFDISIDTLAMLVFEHLLQNGKLPRARHSIELRFRAEPEGHADFKVTEATFIAKQLAE